MVKLSGGRLTKSKREQLLSDLRGLFETKEIRFYTVRKLSKKFSVAKDTVCKYLDEVALEFPAKDIETTQLKFKTLFEEAIETCENLIHRSSEDYRGGNLFREKDIRENIKLMIDLIKAETDFMERFFIKEKVADKLDFTAKIEHKQLVINYNTPTGGKIEQ